MTCESCRIKAGLDRELSLTQKAASLLASGAGASTIFVDGDLPLKGFGVYLALLERCRAVRHDRPSETVNLARCAVEVASRFTSKDFSPRQRADLLALAWAELGNAYRVADNFLESSRAFSKAFAIFEEEGSGDPFLKARLYILISSLHGTQREFTLAFGALDMAITLYKEMGDLHSAGRTLIKKAMYVFYSGRPEDAILVNDEGLGLIDQSEDPGLVNMAAHNRTWFLVACGLLGEANRNLFEYRSKFKDSGKINEIKFRWLEGHVNYGLEKLDSAEIAFREVIERFTEENILSHAALASLDLGLVLMRRDRAKEASQLVSEAARAFTSLGIRREALAAVLLLRDMFEKNMATLTLYESVVKFVRKSDIDPDARFIPPTM
jgi:tetratricopeptide (TPR) repeat protein